MIPTTKLELSKTAIVVIDLQEDILAAKPLFPISAQEVITRNTALIHTFKDTDVLTVLVTVDRTTFQGLFPFPDGTMHPSESPRSVLTIPTLGDQANVIQITKHNPGAFFWNRFGLTIAKTGNSNDYFDGRFHFEWCLCNGIRCVSKCLPRANCGGCMCGSRS
jgi:Amidases related to nicotinamidase